MPGARGVLEGVPPMVAGSPKRDSARMTLPPNTKQRDLVRLAILLNGERTGAKYRPPVKGTA
jgi:hypothetical protein